MQTVLFLTKHGKWGQGDIAGLHHEAVQTLCNLKQRDGTPVAKVASPGEIAAWEEMRRQKAQSQKPAALVSVLFTASKRWEGKRYTCGMRAGFPATVARRFVEVDGVATYSPETEEDRAHAARRAKAAERAKAEAEEAKSAKERAQRKLIAESVREVLQELGLEKPGRKSPARGEAEITVKK